MSNQRITAILAADVAGYTRLMEADEARTLKALNSLREVVGRHVSLHSGRIANTAGDSVLAEFPSAVAAVSCALTLQETLSVENPEHAGLQLRIGVHLGDVVEQAGDLFGTAVNVAARLQSIGEPGTVTVSGVVFDSVRGKLPAAGKDLGPKSLKNIDQPMRVFQLSPTIGASGRVLAVWDKRVAAHGGEERVSIAVLPFLSISGDADMGFIADGLTEDIITELSRQREFLVIARNTVFTYKGRAVDVMQVGRDLSVRYVLEGSLRRLGPRVRLTAQLIACDTGSHLWAEKFDCAEADLMDVQDEIVRAVAASTHTQLVIAEPAWRV
jgi:adenylate cyclase